MAGATEGGKASIRYAMSVAGLPIGSAAFDLDVTGAGVYRITASARVGGILTLVNDGRGRATATGRLTPSGLSASSFALTSVSSRKQQTIQMTLRRGTVVANEMTPPPVDRGDRVPVTPDEKKGVIDPLTAMLAVLPAGADLDPSVCRRVLPVYDGGQRFDIRLTYSRMETVGGRDHRGRAVVCSARYVPIAGHRPDRSQTKFMRANRDMEVWLTPVSGTRILAPWRIVVGTQVGRLVISVVSFNESGNDNTGSAD